MQKGSAKVNLLELYCHVDDFVKAFLPEWNKHLVNENKRQRNRKSRLSTSEIITCHSLSSISLS